ncbi:MAG TPA: hypothetical protein VFF43_14155, partial [Caldimonas sp.]|nr:hypothetical protein [Caldimonas sp.]
MTFRCRLSGCRLLARDCGLERRNVGRAARGPRLLDRHLGENVCRARREQKQPVREPCRLVEIMRHEQGRNRTAIDQHGELVAQAHRKRLVEGRERLVENKEARLDRERPRERHAPGEAERQFAGKMRTVCGEAERVEQGGELRFVDVWRDQADVVVDGAPRQQTWLLEDHADRAGR